MNTNNKIAGIVIISIGLTTFIARKNIYSWFVRKASNFIQATIEDKNVQNKTKLVMHNIFDDIVTNDEYMVKTNKFLKKISHNEETIIHSITYLNNILNDNILMNKLIDRITDILNKLLDNDEIKQKVMINIQHLVNTEENRKLIIEFLSKCLDNQELKDNLATFLKSVASRKDVQTKVTSLLNEAVISNLNDKTIIEETNNLIQSSLQSEKVRTEAADAFYNILKYMVNPWGVKHS